MIRWIEKPLALAIHDRQLAEHGGTGGVRDEKLLESALARPRQLHAYGDPVPDLADLAASLAYGLARNHPFVDGNKRTAAVACETFIVRNDAELEADDLELYPIYLALAEGKLRENDFAAWLRPRVRRTRGHVREERPRYAGKGDRKKSPKRADSVRAKLAKSDRVEDDLKDAVAWARKGPRTRR